MTDSINPSSSGTVLVTGATGTIGSEVLRHLTGEGREVRGLTRSPDRARLPDGVVPVGGELTDVEAMRTALDGVDGLFLLSPVSTEELTGSLLTLDLAREVGVRHVVYLSVIHADRFTEPPHFAGKAAVERMIEDLGIAATILRPAYYMQNDLAERERLESGTYTPPLGERGVLAVDSGDLGEVGARALLARMSAPGPTEVLDVAAPETLTGPSIAAIWADLLGRSVSYGGDDLDGLEQGMVAGGAPGWMARDMRLMFRRFEQDGMVAADGTDARLQELLGRPMRSYREFAAAAVADWRS